MASGDFSRPKQSQRRHKFTTRDSVQISSNSCSECLSQRRNSSAVINPPSVPTIDPDLILKHLKCVRCSKHMVSPLSQCKRGHLICLDCGRQVSLCPLCHAALSGERNFALEMVAEVVPYPCRFQNLGCQVRVHLPRKKSHEDSCKYQPLACPVCGSLVTGLSRGLFKHLQSTHARKPRLTNPFRICLQTPILKEIAKSKADFKDAIVMDLEGFAYVFCSHYMKAGDEWAFLVREFEPRAIFAKEVNQKGEDPPQSCYELRLEKHDGPKLTFAGQVVQSSDSFEGVLSKGSCLRISSSYFLESFSGGFMVVYVKK